MPEHEEQITPSSRVGFQQAGPPPQESKGTPLSDYYQQIYEDVPYASGVNEPKGTPMGKQVLHNILRGFSGRLYEGFIQRDADKKLREADAVADTLTKIIVSPPKNRKFLLQLFSDKMAAQGKGIPKATMNYILSLTGEEVESLGETVNKYIKAGSTDAPGAYERVAEVLINDDPIKAMGFLKSVQEIKSQRDLTQMTTAFREIASNPQMEKEAQVRTLDQILQNIELRQGIKPEMVKSLKEQRDIVAGTKKLPKKYQEEKKGEGTKLSEFDKKFLGVIGTFIVGRPLKSIEDFSKLDKVTQAKIMDAYKELSQSPSGLLALQQGAEGGGGFTGKVEKAKQQETLKGTQRDIDNWLETTLKEYGK